LEYFGAQEIPMMYCLLDEPKDIFQNIFNAPKWKESHTGGLE